jgi:hypothetical protein
MATNRGAWVAVLTLAGCASSAPTVRSTMQAPAPTSAVVVGKFGVYARPGLRPQFLELQALSVPEGKKWNLPISVDDLDGKGNSAAFFAELPPGKYLLTKWLYITNNQQLSGERTGAFFELAPGKVACIGAIYMGSKGKIESSVGPQAFKSGTLVLDECDELAARFKQKAPLAMTPETQLARDLD